MRIAVLGAGAWGTALAITLSSAHVVALWARRPDACETLARLRTSPYLPDATIPETVRIEANLASAVSACDLAIVATPTAALRETATSIAGIRPDCALLWACKGFENATRKLAHEIVAEVLPAARQVGAISGPSFALEVARGLPTALVVASRDVPFAEQTAARLNSARLRLYSSSDIVGVELGGAVKNVIAIAAGIADGLSLGTNARAALVTRGLAEIVRLGTAMGGQPETFMGLAGLGDLVLTCTGALSRNREVGIRLAQGQALAAILSDLGHVAEGVQSAAAVRDFAQALRVDMPITQAVCAVLSGSLSASQAVRDLLARDPRPE